MAADVLGQLVHGRVPALGFLAESLQDDGVEVSRELGPVRARKSRIAFADYAQELRGVSRLDAIGPHAGQQLVQDDPERVHVARGRDGFPPHLLGAGVFRVSARKSVAVRSGVDAFALRLQQLRDSEIEELGLPCRDENVLGLEVAVHDEVRVRVLNGRADLAEQLQPVANRELPTPAMLQQRLALDVLHDEIGLARLRRPSVEQPRDVRMIERRRDLPLSAESPQGLLAGHPGLNQLDGDALLELVVGAAREINRPHSAVAELGQQFVGPDALAGPRPRRGFAEERRQARVRLRVEDVPVPIGRGREGFDLAPEVFVSSGRVRDEGRAPLRRNVERGVENRLDSLPPLPLRRVAGLAHPSSPTSRRSHARAVRHSRLTVAVDTPATFAVSSTVNPPKKRSSTMRACGASSRSRRESARRWRACRNQCSRRRRAPRPWRPKATRAALVGLAAARMVGRAHRSAAMPKCARFCLTRASPVGARRPVDKGRGWSGRAVPM